MSEQPTRPPCCYPDWEGGIIVAAEHLWGKDDVCVICGEEKGGKG